MTIPYRGEGERLFNGALTARAASKRSNCKGPPGLPCAVAPQRTWPPYVPSNPTKIMTMVSTIVCSFMYSSWNAKRVAPHTVSDLKNDNAIIVNDSSRNIQLGVEIDPGCGHHVQTDRLPIRSGDSGSRTLLVVEPFAPRILVKNLVQMKNRSGGGATTKSKRKRTGPHGSSRPKRHERASHQLNSFLGCATFMVFHAA